jgi:hypothetical protein
MLAYHVYVLFNNAVLYVHYSGFSQNLYMPPRNTTVVPARAHGLYGRFEGTAPPFTNHVS